MSTPTETDEATVRHSGLDDLMGPPLLPTDTCDRCGPGTQAKVAIRIISGGMLTFCAHCFTVYSTPLYNQGLVVSVTASKS